MDMQIEQAHCRTAVVSDLPHGGGGPLVRLLSLTSFSAGDLVHRLCMSSSYGCASCRLCLLRHRVSRALVPTSFPQLLDWLTGSSHCSRSFIIQGNTEVKDLPGPGQCECLRAWRVFLGDMWWMIRQLAAGISYSQPGSRSGITHLPAADAAY